MKQRGIDNWEIEHIIMHPSYTRRNLYKGYYCYLTMKLEYDKEVDAAYVYLTYPMEKGEAKKTIEINGNIIADFDEKGQLIGIEILNASKVLSKKALIEADSE